MGCNHTRQMAIDQRCVRPQFHRSVECRPRNDGICTACQHFLQVSGVRIEFFYVEAKVRLLEPCIY